MVNGSGFKVSGEPLALSPVHVCILKYVPLMLGGLSRGPCGLGLWEAVGGLRFSFSREVLRPGVPRRPSWGCQGEVPSGLECDCWKLNSSPHPCPPPHQLVTAFLVNLCGKPTTQTSSSVPFQLLACFLFFFLWDWWRYKLQYKARGLVEIYCKGCNLNDYLKGGKKKMSGRKPLSMCMTSHFAFSLSCLVTLQ